MTIPRPRNRASDFLKFSRGGRLALVLLILFYSVSLVQVIRNCTQATPDRRKDEIVLRLCHWQLETDCREGFEWLFQEYRKIRPDVRVEQLAVGGNGGAYNQWLSTQILGNTAPDLMEVPGMPYEVLITYCSRYFVPLGQLAAEANPYNEGTDLEGVPLRFTFVDGLRRSYVAELQEYYGLPMTIVNCRMYYNRELFQRLTGLEKPPGDLRSFLEVCELIKQQKDPKGHPYVPIAGSVFSYSVLSSWVMNPLGHKAIYLVDGALEDHFDGYPSQDEMFFAWKKGWITFREAPFRAAHKAMRRVTSQFQDGWKGMDRDLSLFIFTQGRAVFIPTGTWDYRSLASQAPFELEVCEIPVPATDDPEFGDVVAGPVFETPFADARFVVNKSSRHQDEATEFLLWFMSQRTNGEFCRRIGWLPSIRGAEIPPEMIPFQPRMKGVQGMSSLAMGKQTGVIYEQQKDLFMLGVIEPEGGEDAKDDYDILVDRYVSRVGDWPRRDYLNRVEDLRRSIRSRETTAFHMRGRWMTSPEGPDGERLRRKYFQYLCDQAGFPNAVGRRYELLEEMEAELDEEKAPSPTPTPFVSAEIRGELR